MNLGDSVTLSKKSKGLIIFAQQLYIPLFFWFFVVFAFLLSFLGMNFKAKDKIKKD